MKTVKFFLSAVALVAVAMVAAPQSAQAAENKDENGKTIRHPYLTNGFWDNTFVGVAGGINTLYDAGKFNPVGFALDVNIGKWVTPCLGLRASYTGITSPLEINNEVFSKDFFYGHGDLMWNISNAIGGYKQSRLWDFVPYAHTGVMRISKDEEFAAGAGLLNIIRICDRLDATLDVRATLVNGRIMRGVRYAGVVTASVGVTYNLFRTDWTRACEYHNPEDVDKINAAEAAAAALTAANAALAADKAKLEAENAKLAAEKKEAVAQVEEAKNNAVLENVGPAAFYFEIGQTKLSEKELAHLDFYLTNILPHVDGKKVTVITGRADSKTGTAKRNKYLSEKRVEYLKKLLVEKYGINADNFQVRAEVVKSGKPALDRAAVISFE